MGDKDILVSEPTNAALIILMCSFPDIKFSEETTVAPIKGVTSATLFPLTVI